MNELIRKITGIMGSTNTNYIPVIHYCVCSNSAEEQLKTAVWIGTSDGRAASTNDFKLYKGLTVAVLFKNGFGSIGEHGTTYSLNIQNSGAHSMAMSKDAENNIIKLDCVSKNSVILFTYDTDESCYCVVNGITGAQLDELREEINGEIETFTNSVVYKETDSEDTPLSQTGDVDQPIYVVDSQVTAITGNFGDDKIIDNKVNPIWIHEGHFTRIGSTVGQNTANAIKPIWLNQGNITTFTVNSGATDRPVYVGNGVVAPITASKGSSSNPVYFQNGTIKEATEDFGGDVTPLKMIGGKLTPVVKDLATQEGLNAEITRATGAEQDLQNAVDNAAHQVDVAFNTGTDELTVKLLNANGTAIDSNTVDFALESLVTAVTYSNGFIYISKKGGGEPTAVPVAAIVNGLVKDPDGIGAGDNTHPIYVDSNGNAVSTSYDLSTFATTAAVQSGYKPKQTAVSDPTASGDATEFIASISQDVNGVITVTKKNVSLPDSFTPTAHTHSASDITSGTLSVARGGTGLSTNPSLLTNLGSTTAATVFQASPRPGITGTLGIGNGGTGATTVAAARTNLGLGTAATHAHGDYAVAGHTHAVATSSTPGFMPKLSGNASQYLNGAGNWVSITDNNYYHTAGNYTLAASSGSSALKATIGGTGVNAITLSVPVYWGSATPTGTSTTGAIYIQI